MTGVTLLAHRSSKVMEITDENGASTDSKAHGKHVAVANADG